jgi:ankyrin repeat protein
LRNAARYGHVEIIKLLISQGLTIDDLKLSNSSLTIAAFGGYYNVIELLISNGLTVQDVRRDNNSALKTAVSNGKLSMIRFLLSQGLTADDLKETEHELEIASNRGYTEVVNFLKSKSVMTEIDAC